MLRCTTLAVIASAALLATAGCSMETLEGTTAAMQSADAVPDPATVQEVYRMFESEKRDAVVSELPAQF